MRPIDDKRCLDCGDQIERRYLRCYRCDSRRKATNWYDPEELPGQAARDHKLGRHEFYVYVLETHYGHYVGHTGRFQDRMRDHQRGKVKSTSGGGPILAWQSRRLGSRKDALRLEAQLKSLRQRRGARYTEITGLGAIPFESNQDYPIEYRGPMRSGQNVQLGIAFVAAVLIVSVALIILLILIGAS